jgi:septum site-determining protein MinD
MIYLSHDLNQELLGLEVIGVIPECKSVLTSTNTGTPVISGDSPAAQAYQDAVTRFLGGEREFRFLFPEPKGILARIFG